jgi:hypothetical protein
VGAGARGTGAFVAWLTLDNVTAEDAELVTAAGDFAGLPLPAVLNRKPITKMAARMKRIEFRFPGRLRRGRLGGGSR